MDYAFCSHKMNQRSKAAIHTNGHSMEGEKVKELFSTWVLEDVSGKSSMDGTEMSVDDKFRSSGNLSTANQMTFGDVSLLID